MLNLRSFSLALGLLAASVTGSLAASSTTITIPTVAALHAGTYTNYDALIIANYATNGDGGGGQFKRSGTVCTDDGGVVFKDFANNCWYRQVDRGAAISLKWYGVADATSSACLTSRSSCDASTAVTSAFAASSTYGSRTVTTDGRSIVIWAADIDIPANSRFTCNAVAGGFVRQSTQPYWSRPNAVVLRAPTVSDSTNRKINVNGANGGARLEGCLIIPAWYVSSVLPTTLSGAADFVKLMRGTAVNVQGDAAAISNLKITLFDICVDAQRTERSVSDWIITWCRIGLYSHGQGGGAKYENWSQRSDVLPRLTDSGGFDIGGAQWGVSTLANSGGEIQITYSTLTPAHPAGIRAGDIIYVQGVGGAPQENAQGDTHTSTTIDDVDEDDLEKIQIGAVVSDPSGGGCFSANTRVVSTAFDPDTGGSVIISLAALCTEDNLNVRYTLSNSGPAGANGRWIAGTVVNGATTSTVVLKGSSWAGPVFGAVVGWNTGTNVIKVPDGTNIRYGQFLCTTGSAASAPLCTPPSDFSFTAASTIGAGLTATQTGTLAVGDTTNWPTPGVATITTGGCTPGTNCEWIAYEITTAGIINITNRGYYGSTAIIHNGGDAITAAAPMVIAVVGADIQSDASGGGVVINTPARATSSAQAVAFANQTAVSATFNGTVLMGNSFLTYAESDIGGSLPSDWVNVPATGSSGAFTIVVGDNWEFIHEGMTVEGANIGAGAKVAVEPTSTTITLDTANSGVVNTTVEFRGCGYPGKVAGGTLQPWLGNCRSVAYYMRGQGITADYLHPRGSIVQFKLDDAQATTITSVNSAGGGGGAQQADPTTIAIWMNGKADSNAIVGGALKASANCILNTPSKNVDGSRVTNVMCGGTARGTVLANVGSTANFILSDVSGVDQSVIYLSSQQNATVINGTSLPDSTIFAGSLAALNRLFCGDGNRFTSGQCVGLSARHQTNVARAATIAALQGGDYSRADSVIVDMYATDRTSGGGTFNRYNATCTDDGGLFIKDSEDNCFKRQYNGRLDLSMFGAYGDRTHNDYAAAAATIAAAQAENLSTVYALGANGWKLNSTLSIPAKMSFICDETRRGQAFNATTGVATGDYTTWPGTLLHTGSTTIYLGYASKLACSVMNTDVISTTAPTSYADLRTRIAAGYTGSGVVCDTDGSTRTGDDCEVEQGNIIGFAKGIYMRRNSSPLIHNVIVDSTTGIVFEKQNVGSENIYDINIESILTYQLPFESVVWTITSTANNGGNYRLNLNPTGTLNDASTVNCATNLSNCVRTGDTIWVVASGGTLTGAESLRIRGFTVSGVTYGGTLVVDTTMPYLSGATTTSAFQSGDTRIPVASVTGIGVGSGVSGTSIAGATTVVAVQRLDPENCAATGTCGYIVLSAATTGAETGVTLTFTDNAIANGGVRIYAGQRTGPGVLLENASHVHWSGGSIFHHTIGIWACGGGLDDCADVPAGGAGSDHNTISNVSINVQDSLGDTDMQCIKMTGAASDNKFIGMELRCMVGIFQNATGASEGNHVTALSVGSPATAYVPYNIAAGDITITDVSATSTGSAFFTSTGSIRLSNVQHPSVTMYNSGLALCGSGSKFSNTPSIAQCTGVLGSVYFSWDSGASLFKLCPLNGLGGVIISGTFTVIPSTCVVTPSNAASFTNSVLNYVYARADSGAVTGTSNGGAGTTVRLTISASTFQTGDVITCKDIGGTIEANGTWVATRSGANIDLPVTFVNAWTTGGTCSWTGLTASTTGYTIQTGGLAVKSDDASRTLVGAAFLGAAAAVNDTLVLRHVISWYNRQPKVLRVSLGAAAATTNHADTNFYTPTTTQLEASWLDFTPITQVLTAYPWIVSASGSNPTDTTENGVAVQFTDLAANTQCTTPETAKVITDQSVASEDQSFTVGGNYSTAPTNGLQYFNICIMGSGDVFTLRQSAVSGEVRISQ